jgi:hypothetical protein
MVCVKNVKVMVLPRFVSASSAFLLNKIVVKNYNQSEMLLMSNIPFMKVVRLLSVD